MQIVIDIPEDMYDWFENGFPDEEDAVMLWQIVKNGTPLEKIRAEIDEQYDRVHPYNISCAEGLEMALDIIDKYRGDIK